MLPSKLLSHVVMWVSLSGVSGCNSLPTTDVTRSAYAPDSLSSHRSDAVALRDEGSALWCGPVSPAALRVLEVLDTSGLEHLWENGRHVNWETGIPDEPVSYTGPNKSSHCSCFAPAMAKRLGIYLLRPPEHSQQLLANAQVAWLHGADARRMGWTKLSGREEAQRQANQGAFVVAAMQNRDRREPGHIAVVRPEPLTRVQLEADGVMVAHSGRQNKLRVSERIAFARQIIEGNHNMVYFAHPVP